MGRGIPSSFARRRSKKPRMMSTPAAAPEPTPTPTPEPAPEPAPTPEPTPAPAPEPAPAPVFSMSNTKKELLEEATRLGLEVGSTSTKAQLLDAILNA